MPRKRSPQDSERLESRIQIRGMWVKESEIKFLEESVGGTLVRNEKLIAFLEAVLHRVIKEEGKFPNYIMIRDNPFVRFVPVRVLADILNMPGMEGIETNRFLFVAVRKVFSTR